MHQGRLHVGILGLGFGKDFAPIYRAHEAVGKVTVCDANSELLQRYGSEFGVPTAASLSELLDDPTVDAVHILTPLPLHAQQAEQVLEGGKHCACAVTMGLSLDEIRSVVEATRRSGKNYMMMETGVYTREGLFARDMRDRGEFGEITFARGDYYQDLEAPYPAYWRDVPPMLYSSHSLGPILAMLRTRAVSVSCVGTGRLRKDLGENPRNPFPMQLAHFKLEGSDVIVQINRAWYQTAHAYVEAFSFYGDKKGFEWSQLEGEDAVVYELRPVQTVERWRHCDWRRTPTPFRPDLLPSSLRPFAEGGHAGAHPHLVHEFLSSIVEGRKPAVDEIAAADWTAAGIVAHESSLKGGEWLEIPRF